MKTSKTTQSNKPEIRDSSFFDKLGITASAICFAHCVLTPVFLALIPALSGLSPDAGSHNATRLYAGLSILDFLHLGLLGPIIVIAGVAFFRGYKLHRHKSVLWLGLTGLLLLVLGAWVEREGVGPHSPVHPSLLFTIAGSSLLIYAHFLNMSHCKDPCCHPHSI